MVASHVKIIVVNWNNKTDTLACLKSLSQLTHESHETVVVDNGSTDGSVMSIRLHYPAVVLLETGENLGYTGGNNVGIQYALDHGADYVLLLNNDTIVDPNFLTELVSFAEAHPKAGIVGPKQLFFSQPDVIVGKGSAVDWQMADIKHLCRGNLESTITDMEEPRQVDYMDGCAVLLGRRFLQQVGMLDERYHLGGYEDADWGMRAAMRGYEVWNVPAAKVWHKISATAGVGSPLTTYYMTRNNLLFFWSRAEGWRRWYCVGRALLRTTRTVGAWTLRPKYWDNMFRRKRNANVLAVRDFVLGRFGAMGQDVVRVCSDSGN